MSTQCKVDIATGLSAMVAIFAGAYHDFIGAVLRVVLHFF